MDAHVAQLQMQYRNYILSLYQQGFLDDQFTELKSLQDDGTPDFVAEVLSLFFDDCVKLVGNMARALDQTGTVDFSQVGANVHQLKVLVPRGLKACVLTSRNFVRLRTMKGEWFYLLFFCMETHRCVRCLQQVDIEYKTLKAKLQDMFNLEKQIVQAGGIVPQVDIN
uniref:Histidine-containing phosphotransfer protein n=1 Tax=Brassica campestris TaxID=3711 RepID=A0A3P5YEW0_BRACM|nr:unnamed protein product [Brassica rapa]